MENGRDEFYKVKLQKLVDFVQNNGGILSLDDMQSYEPVWRDR